MVLMNKIMKLSQLGTGETAQIVRLENVETVKRRLMDLGAVEGTEISCLFTSPSKDPRAYSIKGAVIAIRNSDAERILVAKPL